MRANRALIEWARDNGVAFDRADVPEGDRFACRYEAYLTDPKLEPRKTKRAVESRLQGRGLGVERRRSAASFAFSSAASARTATRT